MGKKSIKEDKNIYFLSREEAGMTRAQASEAMVFVSESRIEKIESEKSPATPEDVVAMAEAYKKPELCNYYCTQECRIGKDTVPVVKESSLSEISLGILSTLNSLDRQKERLIEITEDGSITEDELNDFAEIQEQLNKLDLTVEALKLWVSKSIAEGKIDKSKLSIAQHRLNR